MTAKTNHEPRVIRHFKISQSTTAQGETSVYTRISVNNGKVCLASSQETDAMGARTNWQAIDIDGELSADEILLAHKTLHRFVLCGVEESRRRTPVIAFLHRDNSRIVVCNTSVFCEVAEEIQGITQWRKAPNDRAKFDILTTYVMSVANG